MRKNLARGHNTREFALYETRAQALSAWGQGRMALAGDKTKEATSFLFTGEEGDKLLYGGVGPTQRGKRDGRVAPSTSL
jgi:hypothetical protein